jgi:hypothetical protein
MLVWPVYPGLRGTMWADLQSRNLSALGETRGL